MGCNLCNTSSALQLQHLSYESELYCAREPMPLCHWHHFRSYCSLHLTCTLLAPTAMIIASMYCQQTITSTPRSIWTRTQSHRSVFYHGTLFLISNVTLFFVSNSGKPQPEPEQRPWLTTVDPD
ncbi:hypothetical protein R3P38DRAFT_182697 [Favolaschia claudopus]|uniref:Uncharacterized protein n=1 Tax=Favolaschia claudopus TaxID=2862362 RepID=A0AAW0D2P0_9AGAR